MFCATRAILNHPTDPLLKVVQLTNSAIAIIDARDAEIVGRCNWFTQKIAKSKTLYAATNHNLINESRMTSLHRFIAFLHNLDLKNLIDHKNGDGLDCRLTNLRPATKSTNAMNRGLDKNNTSGIKGVHFDAYSNKWRAEIWANNKHIRLGRFSTLEEASEVIKLARQNIHGEFANAGKAP